MIGVLGGLAMLGSAVCTGALPRAAEFQLPQRFQQKVSVEKPDSALWPRQWST